MDFNQVNPVVWLAALGIYLAASRLALRRLEGGRRELVLALLNVAGVYFFLFYGDINVTTKFPMYLLLVGGQYLMLRWFADAPGRWPWLAFFTPLAALVFLRYVPLDFYTALGHKLGRTWLRIPTLTGISYLAFRCSRLVLEVRNGTVKKPGLWEYFTFAFFVPTMCVGPINTYANFRRGFAATPCEVPAGRAGLRILVGLVKYGFLGPVFNQVGYEGFLRNGHFHPWLHLPVVMVGYYLYLYCNFSGFCDLAIGAAAWIGIPVPENFDNPFAARNIRDFWNRWHITLSHWMRDIVFAPLSKWLVRWLGPARVNHAIALAILLVFLLVGVWHGVGWNFALYGLIHGLGLVINHYYTIGLKRWLGREGFKAYMENRWIHAAAVVVTFCYCAASLMFFANTLAQLEEIWGDLQ